MKTYSASPKEPMTRSGPRESAGTPPNSAANITPGHVRAFQMITSRLYDDRITLWGCTINGEPGVAIVLAEEIAPGKIGMAPLFVAITPGMKLEFDGDTGEGSGEEGGGPGDEDEDGPDRPDIARRFRVNAATLTEGDGE